MADRTPSRPHLRHLDGLRAILATFVVLHHSWLTVYPPESGVAPSPVMAVWSGWMSTPHGLPAVDWFIVLSGFVLTLPVAADGWRLRSGGRWLLPAAGPSHSADVLRRRRAVAAADLDGRRPQDRHALGHLR